jgi:hypothetical protein
MINPENIRNAALDHQRMLVTNHIAQLLSKVDREYDEEINRAFEAGAKWTLEQQRWIPVTDNLPDKPFPAVLATDGKTYFICNYTRGGQIDVDLDDDDPEEFNCEEINQQIFLKAGWYELVEQLSSVYDYVWMKRDIIAWLPLPAPITR